MDKEYNIIRAFFIINTFSAGGGAESLLTTIMNGLDDTGRYEIGMMEIIHHSIKKEPVHNSITVYPYYTEADAPDRKERMYYVYHEWDKVIAEYIPDDYDIYISFNYLKPSFLLPPNKKSIAWIHGDVYNLINKYPNQTKDMTEECELQRDALQKADRVFAISDITRNSLEDIFPEYRDKIVLLPNGVDIRYVRQMSEEHTEIKLEDLAIIYVGRLDANKNPIRALNIFGNLFLEEKKAHLYYLGYGALEEEVRSEVINRCLDNNVHFLGYHSNPFPIMRQAKVQLMTSYSEGFPMALLEGLALGVPFVSSHVGGSRMLSINNAGKEFSNDVEASKEIIGFLKMDEFVIKEACNKTVLKYDLPDYIDTIEKNIREIIGDS